MIDFLRSENDTLLGSVCDVYFYSDIIRSCANRQRLGDLSKTMYPLGILFLENLVKSYI
jgi:hypothetical protein